MSLSSPQDGKSFRLSARRHRGGVALVIVLAFVVLLTGLIVAYFSRSITSRQLSNSSAGQAKASMLAQSASDIVISGLKKEIAGGSTVTAVGPTGSQSNVYVPLAPANAVPVRFPTPAPSPTAAPDLIPNLIRESITGDTLPGGTAPLPSPAEPSLASKVNSSNDAAINGRRITPARWNSHYLIPRANGTADTDSTPDTAVKFAPPDWVLMSRGGPAVRTAVNDGTHVLNDATVTNADYVIGRYSYAIYDEGGLLDMNVAGHPTPGSPAVPTSTPPISPPIPFTATQISQKGSLALADLTQLPTVQNPTSTDPSVDPGEHLSQKVIDMIVGWRNYASANPAGAFPNFTFSSAQASQWFTNFAFGNSTGFLKVYGGPANPTGATDQALLSRQQLLRLRASINGTANPPPFPATVLQYMGTFSRSLEQPSYIPAHIQYPATAPNINAVASSTPPPAASVDSYLGNNDAAGSSGPSSGQDLINPSLLSIRVTRAFNRFDLNKTPAVIGEPLLKKRFPLSRLGEMSYAATDNTPSITDPTSAQNHINDWFGLSRKSTADPWTYNHGADHIMTLEDVRDLSSPPREPDFAELLKAAINVGSLGKGGPNLHNDQGNYQYTLDSSVDYQVLQIMANLIDQYDTDSFPTVVRINASSPTGNVWRTFRGVEDLPYFYRYHPFAVVTKAPLPLLSTNSAVAPSTDKVDWRRTPGGDPAQIPPSNGPIIATTPPVPPVLTTSYGVRGGSALGDGGAAVFLYAPDVWNPHEPSSVLPSPAGARPAMFRLSVVTDDPVGQTPSWKTGTESIINNPYYNDIPPVASIPQVLNPLADGSTGFIFSDNSGKLFREPTLLWRQDAPVGSNIQPDSQTSLAGPYLDINTNVSYIGVQIGKTPVSYVAKVDLTKYYGTVPGTGDATHEPTLASVDGTYIFQGNNLQPIPNSASPPDKQLTVGAYEQYTFRLEYMDPNGSGWIVYDEKYPDIHGMFPGPALVTNKLDFPNNLWMNSYAAGQIKAVAAGYDPRTARFGIGTQCNSEDSAAPLLEAGASTNYKDSGTAGNTTFANSRFTVFTTQRPLGDRGNIMDFSNPGMTSDPGQNRNMRWFDGMGWSASEIDSRAPAWPDEYDGLLSQNDPNVTILARDNSTVSHIYYEDADGIARRAMGAYVSRNPLTGALLGSPPGMLPTSLTSPANLNLDGLPLATANVYPLNSYGAGIPRPNGQTLSRPMMLNRPFRSVAEMSYASRGEPWKQIDFFTPESGDTALLDMFCVNETLPDGLAAGKVNLNTHQASVLQAIVAGTTRDELSNLAQPPAYARPPLTSAEATNIVTKLMSITRDTTDAWRGPLINVGDLVGHYVSAGGSGVSVSDFYSFNEPVTSKQYGYAGLSAALDSTVYTVNSTQTVKAQRLHESAIRALSDSGQTRVWNLMIDVVAQTGRYSPNATALAQFTIDGESRYWVHVAIDRFTGEVIDKQTEIITE